MAAPLTPDFIPHAWRPLASAALGGDGFVSLAWPDGATFDAYSLWLAENADGYGLEPSSRESMLEPRDLPAGVNASAEKCDKSVDTVAMVFEAAPDAAPAQKLVEILPKATEPPKDTKVLEKVRHRVEVAENGNQRPFYTIEEDKFAIAVTGELPVTIECIHPKVPILQSGSMNLKIVATRRNDFVSISRRVKIIASASLRRS